MTTTHRPAALTLVALTLTTALAGCAFGRIGPDETDQARLDALEASLPLPGEVRTELRDARDTSANVAAIRPSARVDVPWEALTDEIYNPYPDDDDDFDPYREYEDFDPHTDPRTFDAARTLRDRLVDAGVTISTITCEVDPDTTNLASVQILGTLPVDDFTAAVAAGLVPRGGGVSLYAPFHTEPVDPWGLEPLDRPTCLDGDTAPTRTTTTGPDLGQNPFSSVDG